MELASPGGFPTFGSSASRSRFRLLFFFFSIQSCHKLLSVGPEHKFQGKDIFLSWRIDPNITADEQLLVHTHFGFQAEKEKIRKGSRATFVNRVEFPSTSSLAPLRSFLLVCVFFCFGILPLFVCFVTCPEHTVTKPKFSHSVHHEGKRHGYYSHVGD